MMQLSLGLDQRRRLAVDHMWWHCIFIPFVSRLRRAENKRRSRPGNAELNAMTTHLHEVDGKTHKKIAEIIAAITGKPCSEKAYFELATNHIRRVEAGSPRYIDAAYAADLCTGGLGAAVPSQRLRSNRSSRCRNAVRWSCHTP